jgi:hypothetical protein
MSRRTEVVLASLKETCVINLEDIQTLAIRGDESARLRSRRGASARPRSCWFVQQERRIVRPVGFTDGVPLLEARFHMTARSTASRWPLNSGIAGFQQRSPR